MAPHQSNKAPSYRGRFAPSPSGALHYGSLIAALGSWLDARAQGGEWLLRMEDLDPPREKPGAADAILRSLEALGLYWDGPVLYQSHRQPAYAATLERLIQLGQAYPCNCSRRELATNSPLGIEGPVYQGRCRTGPKGSRSQMAIRLRTHDRPIDVHDRRRGSIRQPLSTAVGDFIIRRADGLFAYQLAVVVDDAFQGITHIVRGADLLHSTPRQVYLQQLLELTTPSYLHLPLALGDDGRKLSKQHAAHPLDSNRPLPSLLAAWQFLGQPAPHESFGHADEFLAWAMGKWNPSSLPLYRSGR